ncbi:MAG: glycine cleavage system aminomethyltransferase GcvT [Proteobacteria bacterium]|jgi:aminomethyltransferase|nr:glycine cleavage system aminomethyltransferase GcvT [Pseudomonadota bacterium]
MDEPLRRTPLFEEMKKAGGKIVPFAGYEMPVQFAGIIEEHNTVRKAAGLLDVSHMCEFWLDGPDALEYAHWLVTNDVKGLADGQICYTPMCTPEGVIVDDLLVYRYGEERVLLVVNAACHDKDLAHVRKYVRGEVTVTDKSYETGQIALQGPKAFEIVGRVPGGAAFTGLEFFHFQEGTLAGKPCLVSRTGYTAEDGVEIYAANEDMVAVFRAVMEAGAPLGLTPIGLGARDTLRLEGKLMLYGNDIDLTTTPLEAQLGWTVKWDVGDFNGRAALVAQKEQGIKRRLLGLEMIGKGIARHGYPVVAAGAGPEAQPIGQVTSGAPSPTLGKNIGLAYLPNPGYKVGDRVGVVIRGKVIEAAIVKTPFYKRPA